jgi:GNAT superfamily N-acetyltransferase
MSSKKLEFQIRKASKKDAPRILELVNALSVYERLDHTVTATVKLFEKNGFDEHPYFHTLLADLSDGDEKGTVGFALYFFTFSTFTGKPTLYLEDLFVKPGFRGKGIGKRLLVELANIARAKNCARMEWSVLDWNTPSIQFYEAIGAKPMSDWITFRLEEKGINVLSQSSGSSQKKPQPKN